MFEEATAEFNVLNDWIGWGDPHDGVWFVGVEAGGGWCCDTEADIQAKIGVETKIGVEDRGQSRMALT